MPRAFSARKPLERSKRPHNSAVCVNFKFDQASPPSISLLLPLGPLSGPLSPPSLPVPPKSCIINIYRDVSTTRSKGAFIFVEFERKSGRGRALPLPILVWRDIRYSMKIP